MFCWGDGRTVRGYALNNCLYYVMKVSSFKRPPVDYTDFNTLSSIPSYT